MKIAFVCHGNICRSPMAEFVFKDMLRKINIDYIYVCSFATSDEEIWLNKGNPMHIGTVKILNKYGIPYDESKEANQLKRDDYDKFDLFIGMDSANIRNMRYIFGSDPESKIKLLLSYTGKERDVKDPWYTGDFEATYRDILEGLTALLHTLGLKK